MFLETLRGFAGEFLLLLFFAATMAASLSVLDMFSSASPKEEAVAASFAVMATVFYSAQVYCDESKWTRFLVTTTLVPTMILLAFANVAHAVDVELGSALRLVGLMLLFSVILVVFGYVFRLWHVWTQWGVKKRIRQYGATGDHGVAINLAERSRSWFWPFPRRDYIEDPVRFGSCKSAALQLAASLDAVCRSEDAARVRLVAAGWTVSQANSYLAEQAKPDGARVS